MEMNKPKVSIIMPSLNVVAYIRECIESVMNQTLKDIEIICVDAGSTDGTLAILEEYAQKDGRIHLIHSDKKSYGYQMNLGLDSANGTHIGLVETDDFVEPDMFEKLYKKATKDNLDFIKANYFVYTDEDGDSYLDLLKEDTQLKNTIYSKVVNPEENPMLLMLRPATCTGIYSLDFLNRNGIRYLETPGASFQDTSFSLKALIFADRFMMLKDAYYHYRRDNFASSVHSTSKAFLVCQEYEEVENTLKLHAKKEAIFYPAVVARKFRTYIWNYERLGTENGKAFLKQFEEELLKAMEQKVFEEKFLNRSELKKIKVFIPQMQYHKNIERPQMKNTICDQPFSPKVSVIIPIYNTAPYLTECLNSIKNQTLEELEIICINDGSTDNSLSMLESFAQEDRRIKVISQVNMGQSAARNIGVSQATGQYIYFMDSDDRLAEQALEILFADAESKDLDILYFDGKTFYDSKDLEAQYGHMENTYSRPHEYSSVYTGIELFCLLKKDQAYRVSPCLQFIRRKYLDDNNLRFYEGIIYEDNLFSFQCLLKATRVSHKKKALFERRMRRNSTTTSSVQYKHFYGYFTCLIQMTFSALQHHLSSSEEQCVISELSTVKRNTISSLNRLDNNERRSLETLTAIEKSILDRLLTNKGTVYPDTTMSEKIIKNKLLCAQEEIRSIRMSASYKIGRFVTWPFRMIRGGIRCYKEHGAMYTLYRVFEHLKGKAK